MNELFDLKELEKFNLCVYNKCEYVAEFYSENIRNDGSGVEGGKTDRNRFCAGTGSGMAIYYGFFDCCGSDSMCEENFICRPHEYTF